MRSKTSTLEELIPSWMWRLFLTPEKIQKNFSIRKTEETSYVYTWKGDYQGFSLLSRNEGFVLWRAFYPNHLRDFEHTYFGTYSHIETLVELIKNDRTFLNDLVVHDSPSKQRMIQLERVGINPDKDTVRDEILKPMAYLEARGFKFEGPRYALVR